MKSNEEIMNSVTSNGMREWTDARVNQALNEARKDEFFKAIIWFTKIMQYNWWVENDEITFDSPAKLYPQKGVEKLYKQFKKEQ